MSLLVLHLDVSDSWLDLALFMISVLLSYTLLYFFNLIFWLLAFWVHQTWSIVTIKNAIILLLSGATIPFWFLPHRLVSVLEWLPFKSIYFGPLSVILGKVDLGKIWTVYIEQMMWITVLAIISLWLWRKAQVKLVIQGG
ncbi:hypothetical protein D3C86_1768680 [compost metagenome]